MSHWVIIKTERCEQLERELLDESAIRRAVRKTVDEDPELRQRVKRLARERLERPREVGGGAAALIVERADGSTRRINRGAEDPTAVAKDKKRASFPRRARRPGLGRHEVRAEAGRSRLMVTRTTIMNNYGALAEAMGAAVDAAIVETATAIERDVKGGGPHAAPIRTGNLRRSYHQDRSGLRNRLAPSVEVGSDPDVSEYAIYVEYGTSRMAAQPHLTPASEAQRAAHETRVAAAVAGARAVGGRGPQAVMATGDDSAAADDFASAIVGDIASSLEGAAADVTGDAMGGLIEGVIEVGLLG